jgi:hypothetical protein
MRAAHVGIAQGTGGAEATLAPGVWSLELSLKPL